MQKVMQQGGTKASWGMRLVAIFLSIVMLGWFIPAAAIPSVSWADEAPAIPSGYTGVAISSADDLAALAAAVNNGDTCSNKYYYLTCDINAAQVGEWTPIGKSTSRDGSNGWRFEGNPFSGIFDGCGHTVYYVMSQISPSTAWGECYGLFGYCLDATIKNLGVEGTINATSVTKAEYYGGIAGVVFCSLDSNGNVSGNSLVDSCWSNVNISLGNYGQAGGIAGYTGGGQSASGNPLGTHCIFSNCYYKGTLTTTDTGRSVSFGGIAGPGGGGFKNCYFAGKMCSDMAKSAGMNAIYYDTISGDNLAENCYYINAFYTADGSSEGNWQDKSDSTEITADLTAAQMKGANWDDSAGWNHEEKGYHLPGLTYTAPVADQSYAITVDSTIKGGKVVPSKTEAKADETITLTVTPDQNYKISEVSVNGTAITATSGVYSFKMPAKATTVSAKFIRVYNVTLPTNLQGGTVTADKTSAIANEAVKLTVNAYTGYQIDSVKYNDTTIIPTGSTYNFTMPAADVTVAVAFSKINYNITLPEKSDLGTVSVAKTTTTYDDTVTLVINPARGYELTPGSLKVTDANKAAVAVDENNSFKMPASDVTVTASFQKVVYTIANPSVADAKITLDKQTANYRDQVTLTVELASGKKVEKDDIEILGEDGNYYQLHQVMNGEKYTNKFTFTMPLDNVTINAKFQSFTADVSLDSYKFGEQMPSPVLASESAGDVTYIYTFADGSGSTNEQPALVGDYTVAAKIAASAEKNVLYGAYETAAKAFSVAKGDQVLDNVTTAIDVVAGAEASQLAVKSNIEDAVVSYVSDNENVATVDATGKVTFVGVGTAKITATAAAEDYNDATAETVITVKAPTVAKAKLAKSTKNKAKKKIKVKWTKLADVSGYKIYYKQNGKKAKTVIAKANAKSKVLKNLKKNKKYKVKVRAFKTVYGKTYYGAWSNAKSIKITK